MPDIVVHGEGKSNARIMVVGAHPGEHELSTRKPFSGPLGGIVRGALSSVSDSVFYTYLCRRQPQGRIQPSDIDLVALDRDLDRIRPEVVLCCGGFVTRHFLGSPVGTVRGMIVPRYHTGIGRTIKFLPVYDLGHVMRRGGLTSPVGLDWISDIEEIARVL